MKKIIILLLVFTACKQAAKDDEGYQYSADAHKTAPVAKPFKVEGKIFKIADTPPVFHGGISDMYVFISKNLKYPAEAEAKHVEGKVFVQFVVNKEGEVGNVKVVRGIGFGCDEAAVDVIHAMPAWTPAENKGEKVNVQFVIPITFKLRRR